MGQELTAEEVKLVQAIETCKNAGLRCEPMYAPWKYEYLVASKILHRGQASAAISWGIEAGLNVSAGDGGHAIGDSLLARGLMRVTNEELYVLTPAGARLASAAERFTHGRP